MNEPVAPPTSVRTAKRALLMLLAISAVPLVLVLRPLGVGLFLAVVLAALVWPAQRRLSRAFGARRALAAGLLVSVALALLLGPIAGLAAFLAREGRAGVQFVVQTLESDEVTSLLARLPEPLEKAAKGALARLPRDEEDLQQALEKQFSAQGGTAAAAVGAVMSATGSALFQLAVMLIGLFFLLVEGPALLAWLERSSPLLPGQTTELLTQVKQVSSSVVTSTVITCGVQALAALLGYFIASVPHPLFFATLTFFTAFIPAIGAGSTCIAAAALLLVTGHTGLAIFLAIWGVLVVGLVDNVVKPLLIRGGRVQLNGGVVFFSLIGGLAAFGAVGLLLGPLVVAFFLSLLKVYQRDFSPAREQLGVAAPAGAAEQKEAPPQG
jgi:predicted PurR-regulated permease PerM